MARVSVLCLSLLLCSLSGAEIAEQRKVSPESVNVPEQPHPCLSDLHAVLREMSAKLATHEVRMEQQQTLNQEQAAKLKGLETQVDTQKQVGRVAFSASLLESGSGLLGPINAHTTLVFKHVVSNIGNAYSPNTGFFTAPVRGAYHFEFYITDDESSIASAAVLMKNGEHIFIAGKHQTNGYGTSTNGATLLLEVGDVVFLRLWQNNVIYDNENHHSTFSGHLLFPM